MDLKFIPLDYDYVTIEGKTYMKIFGKTEQGKSCCLIEPFLSYFYILSKNPEKLLEKLKKFKDIKRIEIINKNFMEKEVRAIKVFCEHNKIHELSHKIRTDDIKTREVDISLTTKYIIEKKIRPLTWYEIAGEILGDQELRGISNSLDVDLVVKIKKTKELPENQQLKFKPKVLAFDLEAEEFEIGRGEILMISLVSDNIKKVLTWKKCEKKQKYVECFKDEADMIEAFSSYIKQINPDIITGYFSDGFDFPYLRARAEKNQIDLKLGKDNSRILFSRGRPLNARIKGIIHVDLLKFIETAYSQYLTSETLSLNDVASELIGETKLDVDHNKKQEYRNENEWKQYFEYNLKDSEITFKLFQKLWPDMLVFSDIIQEPLFNVTRFSMSALVENYIIHNLDKFNEIAEKRPIHEEIAKRRMRPRYEGAFVLQPQAALYNNLAIFDFTSMYASIIVSFNLSLSTLLKRKQKNSVEVNLDNEKIYFSKEKGFFPKLLEEIIELRKKYKQELKNKPDPIKKVRSNAFKLLANAAYGYNGFFGARWYCPEAAASTAALARKFIKEMIEKTNKQGYEVIYADSIDGETKVIIKKDKEISEISIKKLFKKIDRIGEFKKEYNFKENIEALTLDEKGNSTFMPIKYVMRHKCNKKIYRVYFTNNWYIDVTEDHSLIGYQARNFNQSKRNVENPLNRIIEIKPQEIGKKLNSIITLRKIPLENIETKNYPREVYEFMGYFIGDGSFSRNRSHKKNNKDYYLRLSLGLDKEEVFEKLIKPLINKKYIKNHWFSKTRKGDITINGLKLVNIISKDFRDSNEKKIIPSWLFKEKEENIASFLRGLFSSDGCVMIRKERPMIKCTTINEDYAKEIRKLLYRVGISNTIFKENTINKYKSKTKTYSSDSYSKNILIKDKKAFIEKVGFIIERKNKSANIKTKVTNKKIIEKFGFDIQSVKKIEEIKIPEYVYDIEVENNHKFFANYVLVHNTDGFAFSLNKKTQKQTLQFLKELNKKLPGVMELELEDFYKRGLWVTKRTGDFGAKKKYALISQQGKIKIRGFETVRRDWCYLARNVQNEVLEKILKNGNEIEALKYVKKIIKQIKNREVLKSELTIKTQLKKPLSEYKANTPHITIARKMQQKGLPIDIGMLIQYFISETKQKKALVRDRAKLIDEPGNYDIEYYLNHQILPAIENIFEVFNINTKELVEGMEQKKLSGF